MPSSSQGPSPPRPPVTLFAIACGMAVASVYYAQPLLDAIADDFGIDHGTAGVVGGVTQVGYALGLILLVPLGDVVHRSRLVVTLWSSSVVALIIVGTASSVAVLLAGMALLGALAVVIQVIVAFAASLAEPDRRGRTVGAVSSGVVIGILLSRILAGVITDLASWRAVYFTSAVLTSIVGVVLLRVLPRHDRRAPASITYARLLRSLLSMYCGEPILRTRATLAMLIFATFNVLWTSLVLPLSAPPTSLPHGTIGLFGLVGASGALAAARAGRLADRGRGQAVTGAALALMMVCWLPIGFLRHSLLVLVVGLVLLDAAVQAVHVTNQSIIYTIGLDARSRLVAAYMVFYSIGSAAGSIASTATYAWAGWTGVCLLGAAISGVALLFWVRTGGRPGAVPPRVVQPGAPAPTPADGPGEEGPARSPGPGAAGTRSAGGTTSISAGDGGHADEVCHRVRGCAGFPPSGRLSPGAGPGLTLRNRARGDCRPDRHVVRAAPGAWSILDASHVFQECSWPLSSVPPCSVVCSPPSPRVARPATVFTRRRWLPAGPPYSPGHRPRRRSSSTAPTSGSGSTTPSPGPRASWPRSRRAS